MNSSSLKTLLNEYSYKHNRAISEAKAKKELIYSQNPRLQEIDTALSTKSISIAKSMLLASENVDVENLKKQIESLKSEKASIYKKLNINEDYFAPIFSCKLCNDTGYVSTGYNTEMCKCLKQKLFDLEYNKFNVYNMQNNTFDKFKLDYYSSTINQAKYNSHISPRENMSQILDICNNFITNFDNPTEKNLLFVGNSGLGKTFLSSCIANELLLKGKTVLYQTSPVMLDTIINYRLR